MYFAFEVLLSNQFPMSKGEREIDCLRRALDNARSTIRLDDLASSGVIQSYTAVAAVDARSQIIVAAQALGSGSERAVLLPIVEATKPLQCKNNDAKAGQNDARCTYARIRWHANSVALPMNAFGSLHRIRSVHVRWAFYTGSLG